MPQAKLKPVIPEIEGPQTHDLDRTDSRIAYVGCKNYINLKSLRINDIT